MLVSFFENSVNEKLQDGSTFDLRALGAMDSIFRVFDLFDFSRNEGINHRFNDKKISLDLYWGSLLNPTSLPLSID